MVEMLEVRVGTDKDSYMLFRNGSILVNSGQRSGLEVKQEHKSVQTAPELRMFLMEKK